MKRKPELRPRFGPAIIATAFAGITGALLVALPAAGAYSHSTADDISGWVALAALGWVWWNRMGRKRSP
jgi:ABC-type uncharacterized transport system permease subunit